jgi:hypothetical protein
MIQEEASSQLLELLERPIEGREIEQWLNEELEKVRGMRNPIRITGKAIMPVNPSS